MRFHLGKSNAFGNAALKTVYTHGYKWLDKKMNYLEKTVNTIETYLAKNISEIELITPERTYQVWLDFSKVTKNEEELKELLYKKAKLGITLGIEYGISNNMHIVLYDGGTSKYAGRMYWELKYMGATDVKILNGGLKAWKADRKPVTKSVTNAKKATFTPHINKAYLATMSTVKAAINKDNYVIIDARTPEEYNDTNETSIRLGHIPSAVNI